MGFKKWWKKLAYWKIGVLGGLLFSPVYIIISILLKEMITSSFGNYNCSWGHEYFSCSLGMLFLNTLWWSLILELIIGVPLSIVGGFIGFIISKTIKLKKDKTRFKLVLLITIFILLLPHTHAYTVGINRSVHQHITNESKNVWPLIPQEIKNHLTTSVNQTLDSVLIADYDVSDDIITGSGEQDLTLETVIAVYRNHYFQPDVVYSIGSPIYGSGLSGYKQSGYTKAKEIWKTKVIPFYIIGEIDQAYYWLGHVAHLLEDVAQPGHVLNDAHGGDWYSGDSSTLEEHTGNNYNTLKNTYNWQGKNFAGKQYNYDSLIDNFNWNLVDPPDKTDKQFLELFRLFWYTAQKTQYWATDGGFLATDGGNGNVIYKDLNGNTYSWQCSGTGSLNLWASDGYTICSDFINNSADLNANTVDREANATIPHAMRAVAGLYRLFDDAVRIDWPTENHDYRRTSATLLKGDMNTADDVEKFAFVLKGSGSGQEQVVKPLVADINGNGAMETVTFVHDFYYPSYTEIYAVEFKKKDKNPYSKPKKKKEWPKIAYGGSIRFPGTLANLGRNTPRVEIEL